MIAETNNLFFLFILFYFCSFVQASYARFLWDAEEEEEENENEEDQLETEHTNKSPPTFFHGHPSYPPLAAAS